MDEQNNFPLKQKQKTHTFNEIGQKYLEVTYKYREFGKLKKKIQKTAELIGLITGTKKQASFSLIWEKINTLL